MKKIMLLTILAVATAAPAGSTNILAYRRSLTNNQGNLCLTAQVPQSWYNSQFQMWMPFEKPYVSTQYNFAADLLTGTTNWDGLLSGATWSNRVLTLDGIDDWLPCQTNLAPVIGTNAFTVAAWVYLHTYAANSMIIGINMNPSTSYASVLLTTGAYEANYCLLGYSSLNGISWAIAPPSNIIAIPLNTWVHVAYVRSGVNSCLFTNGIGGAWVGLNGTLYSAGTGLTVGGGTYGATPANYPAAPWDGLIDDAIFVNGAALWTNNFTPPPRTNTAP